MSDTSNLSPSSSTLTQPGATTSPNALSFSDVVNYWVQAGGNPTAGDMAAAVADAASGLNPNATITNLDGTQSVGLWLINKNGTPPGSTDPLANARAAIQQSNNGTDWSAWCVAWSDNACGNNGGTYLGDGSNALASLGQVAGPQSYNVIGAAPTGTGTSAGTASSSSTSGTTGSALKSILLIALIIGLIAAVWWFSKRQNGEAGESRVEQGQSWTPEQEAQIQGSELSDEQLSSQMGRSVRAIRVRRNQIKGR